MMGKILKKKFNCEKNEKLTKKKEQMKAFLIINVRIRTF